MLIEKDMAEVIQRPAIPALTRPDNAKNVVMNTAVALIASKLSSNHLENISEKFYLSRA